MAELNEISLKARSKAHDFIWFSSKPNSFVWFNKYKPFFNESEDLLNCTVEIDSDHYKLYFGKIYSQNLDHQNRRTYYTLQVAEGKRGSVSSQYMYKLVCAYLSKVYLPLQKSISNYHRYYKEETAPDFIDSLNENKAINTRDSIKEEISKSKISTFLDNAFPEEYLSSVFPDKGILSIEAEDEIQNKLKKIIDDLSFEENSKVNEGNIDGTFVFDSMESRINLFLSEFKKITNNDPISNKIALILTNQSLHSDDLNQFDKSEYSKFICLTTNEFDSDTLPLEHKDSEDKSTRPNSNDPVGKLRERVNSLDNQSQKKNPCNKKKFQNEATAQGKKLNNNILWAIIFVMFLIICVRSCSPNSTDIQKGNNQTQQSKTEQSKNK